MRIALVGACLVAMLGCGGAVTVDGPASAGGQEGGVGGAGGVGTTPTDAGHAAIARPMDDGIFLIVAHAPEGRTCDGPDTELHCGHWSVTVDMPWEAVKVGSISLKSNDPFMNAHCIKVADSPAGDGECETLQISGAAGVLEISAIDADVIHGTLSALDAFDEPNLPNGEVDFAAVRCPGSWQVP